jgi:hypothetical protein
LAQDRSVLARPVRTAEPVSSVSAPLGPLGIRLPQIAYAHTLFTLSHPPARARALNAQSFSLARARQRGPLHFPSKSNTAGGLIDVSTVSTRFSGCLCELPNRRLGRSDYRS